MSIRDVFADRRAISKQLLYASSTSPASSRKRLNRLTIERLEARMMFALDVIDNGINTLLQPSQQPENPVVFNTSQAPTITTEATVMGGSTVSGRTAMLVVRAIDNTPSHLLRYTWEMISGPDGAVPRYSANATNAAHSTTITFNRAGQYRFQASVRDLDGLITTSRVDLTVEQVLSNIKVTAANSTRLVNNRAFSVSQTSQQLIAVGIDQFNQEMVQQPVVSWTSTIKPTGGVVDIEQSGNQVTATFNRIGSFGLRAVAGNRSFNALLDVTPVLTALQATHNGGMMIDPDSTLAVNATRMAAVVRGIDQFGNVMSAAPRFSLTAIQTPDSGRVSTRIVESNLTISFSKSGSYQLRLTSDHLAQDFAVNVIPTLSSLLVSTPQNRPLVNSSATSVNTATQNLQIVARDQYGVPLADQPAFTWQTILSPSGAEPTLSPSGNEISISFSRAGTYTIRASGGGRTFDAKLSVVSTLTSIELLSPDGEVISTSNPITVSSRTHRLSIRGYDQFGNAMPKIPTITSVTSAAPTNGQPVVSISGSNATITFNRAGDYSLRFRTANRIESVAFSVVQTYTRAILTDSGNRNLSSTTTLSRTGMSLGVKALDQFGLAMTTQPAFTWAAVATPIGGEANFETSNNRTAVTFDRAGNFGIRASADSKFVDITVRVSQTLSSLTLTPGGANIARGTSQQFRISATDQFGNDVGSSLAVTWSATGGRISSSGVFTAGNTLGDYRVTAGVGTRTYVAVVTIVANPTQDNLQNAALTELIKTYYADGQIDRAEMMDLIRSTGDDGAIQASELADLRYLASTQTNYQMPAHVRELARSVVTSNPANLRYRGQTLGNLIVGSSATHVNHLVDKWFLGTDDPTLTGSGVSYRNATGSLFVGLPTISQARQGVLGDCYFIASMISIAAKNASAIQNMFIDNGDETFTVRFYGGSMGSFYQNGLISSGFVSGSGVASYVTVNRRLPSFSNGTLAYSGMGLSASSSSTPLWIALAEKAYAQWNELGKSGRDGTNRYASIEGGWMSNTNSQVLGYNSTNYPMSSTSKQTLINSLNSGNAVTIGTNGNAASGLIGGHAYVVTGYNASTDRYTLFNPWGSTHPTPLSWQQLQANCSMFVVTNPNGSVSGGAGIVRSSISNEVLAGVGIVDITAALDWQTDDVERTVGLPLAGPMTEAVVCGYDGKAAIPSPTFILTHFIASGSTSDLTGNVYSELTLGLELSQME